MGRHGRVVPKEWVVDLYYQNHWQEMPEDWFRPSSRRYVHIRGMYPRTFHGVVRQIKELIRRTEEHNWITHWSDLRDCQLRNVKTGEVIPWAALGT